MNTRQLWLDVCLTLLWFGFIHAVISGDLMIAALDMTAEFTWSGPADAFLFTWLLNGTVAPLRIFVYILVSTNWHFIQASCGSHITTYIFCTISSNFCSLSRQLNLKLKCNPINWSQCTRVLWSCWKIGSGHLHWRNWDLITKCICMLSHQSDCSGK